MTKNNVWGSKCRISSYRNEILQKHPQPSPKDDQMKKIDTGSKFKMAAAAILEITFLAISWPLLHIFPSNLVHKLKAGSRSQNYHQNSHRPKIQDGGGHNFETS